MFSISISFFFLSLTLIQSLLNVKNPFKMVDALKIYPGDSGIANYPHVVLPLPSPPIYHS